jgi:hypothetical protein
MVVQEYVLFFVRIVGVIASGHFLTWFGIVSSLITHVL